MDNQTSGRRINFLISQHDTLEKAMASCEEPEFFSRTAILKNDHSGYSVVELRRPIFTKDEGKALSMSLSRLGYTLVAYTDALFGWEILEGAINAI